MRALVLSGGLGERLRPITLETPKPLLEVGGRLLIHYPLLMLKQAGITEVAINVHHLPGCFHKALGNGAQLGMRITYAPEPLLLGSGGPFLTLKDFFGDQPFVVLNADSILDIDLGKMIEFHRDRGSLVTVTLHNHIRENYYSRIEVDAEQRIRRMRLLRGKSREFEDFPPAMELAVADRLQPLMFSGGYICEPSVLSRMPKCPPFSSMRDVFAPMVSEGLPLFGYVHEGWFRTVDDLTGYEALKREFVEQPPRLRYLEQRCA